MDEKRALIITGETGKYNLQREAYKENPLHLVLGIRTLTETTIDTTENRFIYHPVCIGKTYYEQVHKDFNQFALSGNYKNTGFNLIKYEFVKDIKKVLQFQPSVDIEASPFASAQICQVSGKAHIFMGNFKGIKAGENVNQIPEEEVKIIFSAKKNTKIYALEFLGSIEEIKGTWRDGKVSCVIPEIKRGMVVWSE